MTYSELYNNVIERLNNVCIKNAETSSVISDNEARSNVDLLFHYLLHMSKNDLFMKADDEISLADINVITDAVELREKHIPLQHITGVQEFMGLEFDVSKDVLIPRFDTECLVEEAMLLAKDGDKVLDVCTGSGCVIISLMHYKNDITGFASDISEAALINARSNARKHNKNIKFIKSSMLDDIDETGFDIITCNPPYIKTGDIDGLMDEVRLYDPREALDGGEDGLVYIKQLVKQAKYYLKPHGQLLFEIGFSQGNDAVNILEESGYRNIRIIKDLAGNDRVASADLADSYGMR